MINLAQQSILIDLLKPINPKRIGIFGSYARGENNEKSDLDILVHLESPNQISLLKLVSVEQDLSEALGIPIDLVTDKSLSPHVRPFVEKDLHYIF